MKKIFLFVALALTALTHSAEHRVTVNPTVYWSRSKQTLSETEEVEFRGFNYGLCGAYEYLAPNSIYWEAELFHGFSQLRGTWKKAESSEPAEANYTLTNVEAGVGYSAEESSAYRITAYAGLGDTLYRVIYSNSPVDQFLYALFGVKWRTMLSGSFDVGINAKLSSFLTHINDRVGAIEITEYGLGAFELSAPLIWHAKNAKDQWDVQVEPFYEWRRLLGEEKLYGTKLTVGYFF